MAKPGLSVVSTDSVYICFRAMCVSVFACLLFVPLLLGGVWGPFVFSCVPLLSANASHCSKQFMFKRAALRATIQ